MPPLISVVTTFSPQGYESYGHAFLDSFLRHWPAFVGLHVFLEGQRPPFQDARIHWHELNDDPEHVDFCDTHAGRDDEHDWNMMPVKFCHKVFAVTSSELPRATHQAHVWRVWIDADTITTKDIDEAFLARLLPTGKALAFLGRTGFMRPGQPMYTECGFVGYNVANPSACAVLHDMRALFTTGKLFGLGRHNWHDSFAFDHCRRHIGFHPDVEHNLSAHCKDGELYPWDKSILAERLEHRKGPRRKAAAYGAVV